MVNKAQLIKKGWMFMKKTNIFILGSLLGAAASLLLTPKTGKEIQKDLLKKVDELQMRLKDFELSDAKQMFTGALDEVKASINNFDWEASKSELESKFNEIKDKLNDIMGHLDEVKTNIKEEAQTVGENLEDDFTLVIESVKDTVKETKNQAKATAVDVADTIKEDSKMVVDATKEAVEQIKTTATDMVETIIE